MLVFAFTFTTNMDATTVGRNTDYKKYNKKKKKKKKNNPNYCDPQTGDQVPLDGGLGVLVLGAAAFGVRKLRNRKNG